MLAVIGAVAFASLLTTMMLLRGIVALGADSKDRSDMVRVPAGSFWMGSKDGPDDERPQHQVDVAEFSINRTEVTNGQFAQFMNA